MFKSFLVAGSMAISVLALSPAAEAETRTRFNLYLGVPFYGYQVEPDWRYYEGYGWYDYERYGDFRRYPRAQMSCSEARRLVDRSGYDRVRTVECAGRTYTFRALTRRGNIVTVYVNSRTGALWRG